MNFDAHFLVNVGQFVVIGHPLLGFEARGEMAFRKSEPHRTSTNRSLLVDAIKGNNDALLSSLDAGAAVDEMDISPHDPTDARCEETTTWIAYGC